MNPPAFGISVISARSFGYCRQVPWIVCRSSFIVCRSSFIVHRSSLITLLPLVSIIMPCYNAEEFIAEAINSVIAQTHSSWELIIVNDGSTDNSESVILSFKDNRIKYFKQENHGQCRASNFGLSKARGDYIKFFDADDVMNGEHLDMQLKKLYGNTNSIASCAWARFYDNNFASAKLVPETVWKDMEPLSWLRTALQQKYDMMGAWVWLIPIQLIKKTGGWDERLSLNNDFEFSIRLLLHADKVLFAKNALMYYRSGLNNTLSQKPSRKKYEQAILSTDIGCSYLLQTENSDEMRLICANRYQEWLYQVYPAFPDLQEQLANKIVELGGSDRKYDGGRVFQIISSLLGWKITKRIKMVLKTVGYNKLPFK